MDMSGPDMLQADIADRVFVPPVPTDRDVSQVRAAECTTRKLPRVTDRPRSRSFQPVITRSSLNDMHLHGRSAPDVEVCGVLVGNVYRDDHGPYLFIQATIRGNHAAGRAAQVTFTADTWNHINDEMERNFPGQRIVGWYHTHPGFGIFLSEMDRFIHNNFFPEPWQVAYVYDPKSHEDGLFMWKDGHATRGEYLIDPDTVSAVAPRLDKADNAPTGGTLAELTERIQRLETRVKWLSIAVCGVATLAVLLPLIAYFASPEGPAPQSSTVADHTMMFDEPNIPPSLRMPPSSQAVGDQR